MQSTAVPRAVDGVLALSTVFLKMTGFGGVCRTSDLRYLERLKMFSRKVSDDVPGSTSP
jgi:hypothetical protein